MQKIPIYHQKSTGHPNANTDNNYDYYETKNNPGSVQ